MILCDGVIMFFGSNLLLRPSNKATYGKMKLIRTQNLFESSEYCVLSVLYSLGAVILAVDC